MAGAARDVLNSRDLAAAVFLITVTLACYWTPMTSSQTTILWDAADYFQPVQNYLSQELRRGRIPFWNPYSLSGHPFLAEPQVGAWYPFNWPFIAAGVPPRVLVVEHFVHAAWACLGAYFLSLALARHRLGAVLAGLSYGLSGFFVGHSSHTPMLQAAAWLPWLLWLFTRAMAAHPQRHVVLGGLVSGLMILAGHFQTALYSFMALGLFAVAHAVIVRRSLRRALAVALLMPIIGTLLSAIATAPGLELVVHSTRTSVDALTRTEGMLQWQALATLVVPNYYGVLDGVASYRGPSDITQFYFYAGFALVPLAIIGLTWREVRWLGLSLVVPTIWYALGHSYGLYLLIARLPGFSSVRAPVNIWFVPALAFAMLAGAGLAVLVGRTSARWTIALAAVSVVLTAMDLTYRNSLINPLAYGRLSYEERYGDNEEMLRLVVATRLPSLTRFDAPSSLPAFGSLSHALNLRIETTYGYFPLPLSRYQAYLAALKSNGRLRHALGVSWWLNPATGGIVANPQPLARAHFPRVLVPVQSPEESSRRLRDLDPATEALVPDVFMTAQDAAGVAEVREFAPGHYRIYYRCATPSVLRVSNTWYPGWTARIGDRRLDVFPIDHALMGIAVPSGERELTVDYVPSFFMHGAAVTLIAFLACIYVLARSVAPRARSRAPLAQLPHSGLQ